ncbi:MAG: GAF domain-containing protein [Anaerolineae bacterium]|nr:GAF domain-containing protein [Anaerolineae bacterium]
MTNSLIDAKRASITTNIDQLTDSLSTHLADSTSKLEHLEAVLDRTLQALTRRGVQIQIDFSSMLRAVNTSLEAAQKTGRGVSKQLVQLQELVHTSALLTSSLEFDKVLEEVMDTVIKLTGAERAYLMLRQSDSEDLRVQVARNWDQQSIADEAVTFSQGIVKTAIDQGTPLVATNALDDERFAGMKSVVANELRSIVVVPLILKDKVVGVLYADNRIEQGVFNVENIPILSAFANQAAIAISNARLFEKVRDDLAQAQREVRRLLIEIDQQRVQEKVDEITESDYFRELSVKARKMRRRVQGEDEASS